MFEDSTPLALKVLQLEWINLRYVSNSYMKVINMPALEELSIWECPGADALFDELKKPHLRPLFLETLRFYHHDDDQHYGLGALQGFLRSTSGLVTLHIEISNTQGLPKAECIVKHSASLESLSVYASKTDMNIFQYSPCIFSVICGTSRRLRRLSISFPPRSSLLENGNMDFDIFLVSDDTSLRLFLAGNSSCPELRFKMPNTRSLLI